MDVFSLAKLIETEAEDDDFEDVNNNKLTVTPIKMGLDKSQRKSNKVFSAFKDNPHPGDVKLLVNSYLNDVGKRL